ncbi:unnamed protein product, partial [Brassica oleracea var. botrytis]
ILSRHNDEQQLNVTGQLILNGPNDYFQSGQLKPFVEQISRHLFQAGFEWLISIYSASKAYLMWTSLRPCNHVLSGHGSMKPLEVLSEDLHARCVMVLHEEEGKPTWIHKKSRTRLVCVTRTRVTS